MSSKTTKKSGTTKVVSVKESTTLKSSVKPISTKPTTTKSTDNSVVKSIKSNVEKKNVDKQKKVSVTQEKKKVVKEDLPINDVSDNSDDHSDDQDISDNKSPKKKAIPTFKFDGEPDEVEKQVEDMLKDMDEIQKEVSSKFTIYKHFLKQLSKTLIRMRKKEEAQKIKKESRKSGKRLAPEFDISDELCIFMGLDPGSKSSRTNALAVVSKYAKEHDLNGIDVDDGTGTIKTDKRLINLDKNLESIFPNLVDSDENLGFTTIIRHLNQHFPKKKSNLNQIDSDDAAE